jgi:excinuclease UvrABC nuclease subunit
MRRRIAEHAAALRFEAAARLKEQVEALAQALEAQTVEREVDHDQDVLHVGDDRVLVMSVVRGAVVGCDLHDLRPAGSPDRFVLSRYADDPEELIVNRLEDRAAVQRALTAAGRRVTVTTPPAGRIAQALLELCALNHAHRTRPATRADSW